MVLLVCCLVLNVVHLFVVYFWVYFISLSRVQSGTHYYITQFMALTVVLITAQLN